MFKRYPLWKYLLVLFVATLGVIYSAPNLYAPDPAVQISGQSGAAVIDERTLALATEALDDAGIEYFGAESDGRSALLRLKDMEMQLAAKEALQRALGYDYVVALNLAPTTPDWLLALGASPMKLGLDLAGGVHFLLEVDTAAAMAKRLESTADEIKANLRRERIRYRSVELTDENVVVAEFGSEEERAEIGAAF